MIYQEFYILEHREQKEMTQKELAHILGFSGQFMGRIEKNQVDLPTYLFKRCAKVLGIKYADLVDFYCRKYRHDLKAVEQL